MVNIRPLKLLFVALCGLGIAGANAQTNLIARLRPGANASALAQQYSITFKEQAPGGPFFLFIVPVGMDPNLVRSQMALNPDVAWVEDDDTLVCPESVGGGKGGTVAVINARNSAYGLNANALAQVGFSRPFTLQPGRTVRIAVIDTGVAPSCTILWSKTVAQYNAVDRQGMAYDMARGTDSNQNGIPDEGVGHGTFVAGIIDQLSPQSRLVVVRAADSDGVATAWSLIKGISFSVKAGSEVLNISLGADHNVPALSDVMEWAKLSGAFVVSAAGNENQQMVYDPAGLSKVLAVTGVDPNDHKATFANYDGKMESCAPATGIKSYGTNGLFAVWSGTSFAAPFASGGVIECLRHLRQRVDAEILFGKVEKSGTNIDALNPNYQKKLGLRLWLPDLWKQIRGY